MNKDPARKWTDKELKEMSYHIGQIYEQATDEITAKWDAYMARAAKRLDKLHNEYVTAPDDEKEEALKKYQKALENVTFKDQYYKDMVLDTSKRLCNTNKIATAYMNGEMPKIYRVNYDQIDPMAVIPGIRFDMVSEETIANLIKNGTIPQRDLDERKDITWNTKQIGSTVLQGIIQGESIKDIAKRIMPIVNKNEASAIRNARTMTTCAENRGRLDRYADYESKGLIMAKVWIATGDDRTRDWHLSLDGQEVAKDEEFTDGLGNKLMYPGDPDAAPETTWNCRCSMRSHILGVRNKDGEIVPIADMHESGLHQEQIAAEREKRGMEEPEKIAAEEEKQPEGITRDYNTDFAQNYGKDFYDNLCDLVDKCGNADLQSIWQTYQGDISAKDPNFRGGAHAMGNGIHVNKKADEKGNDWEKPYSVTFHESGHAIDFITRGLAETDGLKLKYSSAYENGLFPKTIREEVADLVKAKDAELKAAFKEHKDDYEWLYNNGFISDYKWNYYQNFGQWFGGAPSYSKSFAYSALEKEVKSIAGGGMAISDLSDMLEGATGAKIQCGYGHGKTYWQKGMGVDAKLATEAFAEMTSATITTPESLEVIKKYLPKSYKVYEEMLKDIAKKGGKK